MPPRRQTTTSTSSSTASAHKSLHTAKSSSVVLSTTATTAATATRTHSKKNSNSHDTTASSSKPPPSAAAAGATRPSTTITTTATKQPPANKARLLTSSSGRRESTAWTPEHAQSTPDSASFPTTTITTTTTTMQSSPAPTIEGSTASASGSSITTTSSSTADQTAPILASRTSISRKGSTSGKLGVLLAPTSSNAGGTVIAPGNTITAATAADLSAGVVTLSLGGVSSAPDNIIPGTVHVADEEKTEDEQQQPLLRPGADGDGGNARNPLDASVTIALTIGTTESVADNTSVDAAAQLKNDATTRLTPNNKSDKNDKNDKGDKDDKEKAEKPEKAAAKPRLLATNCKYNDNTIQHFTVLHDRPAQLVEYTRLDEEDRRKNYTCHACNKTYGVVASKASTPSNGGGGGPGAAAAADAETDGEHTDAATDGTSSPAAAAMAATAAAPSAADLRAPLYSFTVVESGVDVDHSWNMCPSCVCKEIKLARSQMLVVVREPGPRTPIDESALELDGKVPLYRLQELAAGLTATCCSCSDAEHDRVVFERVVTKGAVDEAKKRKDYYRCLPCVAIALKQMRMVPVYHSDGTWQGQRPRYDSSLHKHRLALYDSGFNGDTSS